MPNNRGTCLIASLSGIRGILNEDLTLSDVARFARNFALAEGSDVILVGRDSRSTGPTIAKAVAGALESCGVRVVDFGVVTTPALFRESRVREKSAVMVTASHNEPEYNGMKFISRGRGIGKEVFEQVTDKAAAGAGFRRGKMTIAEETAYSEGVVRRFGEGSCGGIRAALDFGGGAAAIQVPRILRRLGCEVLTVNDTVGVFNRRVDPVADDLSLLIATVKEKDCDIGLGFDCDGDRLVIVDSAGRKRTGDYMLTLAVSELQADPTRRKVVVSMDTTQAVEDVVRKAGGEIFRAKVGEANVVRMMEEKGAKTGGEGSSGGLIDAEFNYCRDSMVAAAVIMTALCRDGRKVYDGVPTYHQTRIVVDIQRAKALSAISRLAKRHGAVVEGDSLRILPAKRTWVLVRPSGTEDVVRVSAEAPTPSESDRAAKSFASELKGLSR